MSDQDWADKVAEIECYSIEHTGTLLDGRKKYKIECGVKTSEPMSIDRVNTIIRSSAPDARLITAARAMVLLVEDYEAKTCKVIRAAITIGKDDWKAEAKERELAMHKMFEFLDTLRAALADCKPEIKE